MFRTLARLLNNWPAQANAAYNPSVFEIHPYQLSQWLESAWTWGGSVAQVSPLPAGSPPYLGSKEIRDAMGFPNTPQPVLDEFLRSGIKHQYPFTFGFFGHPAPGETLKGKLPWDHAAYAMVIESTGVYEILAEVTRRYVIGETLEPPSVKTEQWLRSTEELFFSQPPPFHIVSLDSRFRPDQRVTRRNLYWRLLGMDLPHPLPAGGAEAFGSQQPWKKDVGVANTRFHELWLDLLREVWTGYENVTNTSGAKPTDPSQIAEICKYLQQMLDMRRINGQLAREEFVAVSQLSWFHLTVEVDSPLVVDLKAQGFDPFDRLIKIGERVGMKPSPHAWELFQLADPMSSILRFIELGYFNTLNHVPPLYTPAPGNTLQSDMLRVIDLWEMATGDVVKGQGVRVAGQPQKPVQHHAPSRSLVATGAGRANGSARSLGH